MHYIGFVIRIGEVPYRGVLDMNFPACYLPDMLLGLDPGGAAFLWRFFDLGLVCTVFFGYCKMARGNDMAAAVWAGALFAVIHLRDGIEQAGERDLTAGVFLLIGVVFLMSRRRACRRFLAFGLLVGVAALFKPTLLVFYFLVFVSNRNQDEEPHSARLRAVAAVGVATPVALAAALLFWDGAGPGLWYVLRTLSPYHASLGRLGLMKLLYFAVSPVLPLVILCVLVLMFAQGGAFKRSRVELFCNDTRRVLTAAAFLGLVSFLLQGKGYPYQRYPFLIAVLPLLTSELRAGLRQRPACQMLAWSGLVWCFLIFTPTSIYKASGFRSTSAEFIASLEGDLEYLSRGGADRLMGGCNAWTRSLDALRRCTNCNFGRARVNSTTSFFSIPRVAPQ